MQILLPFSGGVNSTYLLWKTLMETDHKVTTLTLLPADTYPAHPNRPFVEKIFADLLTKYKETISRVQDLANRSIKSEYVKLSMMDMHDKRIIIDMPPFTNSTHYMQVREGFDNWADFGNIWAQAMDIGRKAHELRVDEIWLGFDAQNTQSGWLLKKKRWGELQQLAPNAKLVVPNYRWEKEENYLQRMPDSYGPGHWEQYSLLPKSLQELVQSRSGQFKFYHEHVENSKHSVATWDKWASFLGCYGHYHHHADPATWYHRQYQDVILKIENYDGIEERLNALG